MQLSMTVLRCPDQVAPEARTVPGGEFHVGRGPGVDWVLPDPDRLLSKQHFAVAFRGGDWQVADTSTNGTYLNGEGDSIGRGATRSLRDGDRLRLGAYEIEVRLVEQPMQGASGGGFGAGMGGGGHAGQSPFGDPFADDPLAPPQAARRPFDEPAYHDVGMGQSSAQLPHDFDPLAPDRDDPLFGGGFRGPVQADHSSSMEDAMAPPAISGYSAPQSGGVIPGDDLLPDDWDKDLLEGIAPPQPLTPGPASFAAAPPRALPVEPLDFLDPLAPDVPAEAARPVPSMGTPHALPAESLDFLDPLAPDLPAEAARPVPSMGGPQALPAESLDFLDPLAPDLPAEAARPAPEAAPVSPVPVAPLGAPLAAPLGAAPVVRQRAPRPAAAVAIAPPEADPFIEPEPQAVFAEPAAVASPFDEPSDPREIEPAPTPAQMPGPAAPAQMPKPAAPAQIPRAAAIDDGALAAFFQGAELTGATPSDPAAMMTGLGQAFRAMVAGLRSVLIARATIKGEFRIEQTMIRARGNNPLKFSANDDDALTALLGVGRRTDMTPAAAIEDSLRDLRMHELATMAAMQVAVRAMLDEFNPEKIRAGTDQGGLGVLPGQRKARAWDAFEARHASVVQALVDDFDSIFGKSFARAYERALDEISTRERQ